MIKDLRKAEISDVRPQRACLDKRGRLNIRSRSSGQRSWTSLVDLSDERIPRGWDVDYRHCGKTPPNVYNMYSLKELNGLRPTKSNLMGCERITKVLQHVS